MVDVVTTVVIVAFWADVIVKVADVMPLYVIVHILADVAKVADVIVTVV